MKVYIFANSKFLGMTETDNASDLKLSVSLNNGFDLSEIKITEAPEGKSLADMRELYDHETEYLEVTSEKIIAVNLPPKMPHWSEWGDEDKGGLGEDQVYERKERLLYELEEV